MNSEQLLDQVRMAAHKLCYHLHGPGYTNDHMVMAMQQLAPLHDLLRAGLASGEPVAWIKRFHNSEWPALEPAEIICKEEALKLGWRPLVYGDAAPPAAPDSVAVPRAMIDQARGR